jgi:nucleoside-diphosphate-sugar epimerase
MEVLVTGGGGFLGRYLVERLLQEGNKVTVLCRGHYPELEKAGAILFQADLNDASKVQSACKEKEIVFHVAAKAGYWGKYEEYYRSNVLGTQHILEACQSQGVSRLVYTSTPSVIFEVHKHLEGVDESTPYSQNPLTAYQKTKIIAEQEVLKAHGQKGLKTVALRPHIIWGPRDNHILPRIIARAQAGKLKQVGEGKNKVGIVYIDNAVEAHLQAARSEKAWGNAYFITQKEPVVLWEWINQVLKALDIPPVQKKISFALAYRIGGFLELVYKGLSLPAEPPMTRFLAAQLGESHYFDIGKAERDFGYNPKISVEEGIQKFVTWLKSC